VEHEARIAQALEAIDHLLRFLGAERRGDDRLGLAAGEQRRAVGARQEADDRLDRADGLGVAAVDTAAFLEDGAANDVGLRLLTALDAAICSCGSASANASLAFIAGDGQRAERWDLSVRPISGLDILADEGLELGLDRGLAVVGGEVPWLLGGFLGEADDRFADLLAGRMGEHDGAKHDVFRQLFRFGFDHHHRAERAGDDEVELPFGDLGVGRVEDVLAVDVTDARGADRAHERDAGDGEGGRRGDHRQDVGLVLAVVGRGPGR